MKTELTKQIEKALSTYRPDKLSGLKINYFRQIFGAPEVLCSNSDIKGGIVDYMKFNEYFVSNGYYKGCVVCNKHYSFAFIDAGNGILCKQRFKNWKEASSKECIEDCRYSRQIERVVFEPLFTCFEIKISKEDFKSTHGHNFVGNLNYYVMPVTLYKQIKGEIPENIGVIAFSANSLRQVKHSTFRQLTEPQKFNLLLCLTKALLRRG